MQIRKEQKGDVTVVAVSGKVDAVSSTELENELMAIINDNCRKVVLDVQDMFYISSAGLRVILAAGQALYEDGQFVLARPQAEVLDILEMTGFDTILTITGDLESALAEFK